MCLIRVDTEFVQSDILAVAKLVLLHSGMWSPLSFPVFVLVDPTGSQYHKSIGLYSLKDGCRVEGRELRGKPCALLFSSDEAASRYVDFCGIPMDGVEIENPHDFIRIFQGIAEAGIKDVAIDFDGSENTTVAVPIQEVLNYALTMVDYQIRNL